MEVKICGRIADPDLHIRYTTLFHPFAQNLPVNGFLPNLV